jgi:hypothetical protein
VPLEFPRRTSEPARRALPSFTTSPLRRRKRNEQGLMPLSALAAAVVAHTPGPPEQIVKMVVRARRDRVRISPQAGLTARRPESGRYLCSAPSPSRRPPGPSHPPHHPPLGPGVLRCVERSSARARSARERAPRRARTRLVGPLGARLEALHRTIGQKRLDPVTHGPANGADQHRQTPTHADLKFVGRERHTVAGLLKTPRSVQ